MSSAKSAGMRTIIPKIQIVLAFLCIAWLTKSHAVLPPPDGGYPNFNTAEGDKALFNLTTGIGNTAVGWFSLESNTDGTFNTAVGAGTLLFNVGNQSAGDGVSNTAVGTAALLFNTSGSSNTAVGSTALLNNIIALNNTAVGASALSNNDSSANGTADSNTAVGALALSLNVNGQSNTAVGDSALQNNDSSGNASANGNTAVGSSALLENINAPGNTAIGDSALRTNDLTGNGTASGNTAVGNAALLSNTNAAGNTAVGENALLNTDSSGTANGSLNTGMGVRALENNVNGIANSVFGSEAGFNITGNGNTAVGFLNPAVGLGITTGNDNVAIGGNAGAGITAGNLNVCVGGSAGDSTLTFNNNIYIGHDVNPPGPGTESSTIRIGGVGFGIAACFIQGIVGAPNFADTVKIDPATGQLGDQPSSARFKKDIDSMGNTSEAIFSLRPVTFHYKNDTTNAPQFGLIAEEVAKIDPALIGVDKEGKPYCVQYDKINAMLLNEFLKAHGKIEQQQKQIDALKAELNEQRALIQKVSAQIETSASAVQVAAED
jgi:hypothetical protein